MMIRILVVVVVLLLAAGVAFYTRSLEPVVGIPGGELSGQPAADPSNWPDAAESSTIQLETNPEDPYSVNLWGVGMGENFYVATRAEGTGWSRNLEREPQVRLRIGENIYARQAVRVQAPEERQQVLQAYVNKYQVEMADIAENAALMYRLERR